MYNNILKKEGYNLIKIYPNVKLQYIKAHTNNTDKYFSLTVYTIYKKLF